MVFHFRIFKDPSLKFSLICTWINDWVNGRKVGDLRRHRAHYVVILILNDTPAILGKIVDSSTHKPPSVIYHHYTILPYEDKRGIM